MPPELSSIRTTIAVLPLPAFLTDTDGAVVALSGSLREELEEAGLDPNMEDLYRCRLFNNSAEFRGFLRSFAKLGRQNQRIVLPGKRLGRSANATVLEAALLELPSGSYLLGILPESSRRSPTDGLFLEAYRNLIRNLPSLFATADLQGNLTQCSEGFARAFLGAASAEGGSLKVLDTNFDGGKWLDLAGQVTGGQSVTYETRFRAPEGEAIPVRITLVPTIDRRIGSLSLTVRDLREKWNLQQQLHASEQEIRALSEKVNALGATPKPRTKAPAVPDDGIIGSSLAIRNVIRAVHLVANTEAAVLVTGETGTGKELIVRHLHAKSHRAAGPLVIVNCGALPRELVESELFGYRKGAFTGANRDYKGFFERADGGTLFLDEIGELPLEMQTRLLRFLQEGTFRPVGGTEALRSDVRIVSATNRALEEMVTAGRFRPDLLFRLNVFPIESPALRDRKEDIPTLAKYFLGKYGPQHNPRVRAIDPAGLRRLMNYSFPGNVRELENLVKRELILARGETLQFHDLPVSTEDQPEEKLPEQREEVLNLEEVQRRYISQVLRLTGGKVSGEGGAARLLGLKDQTLFSKMRRLGIDRH